MYDFKIQDIITDGMFVYKIVTMDMEAEIPFAICSFVESPQETTLPLSKLRLLYRPELSLTLETNKEIINYKKLLQVRNLAVIGEFQKNIKKRTVKKEKTLSQRILMAKTQEELIKIIKKYYINPNK